MSAMFFTGFASFNKSTLPLRKRVPSDVLNTVANARDILISQFGPLLDEEPSSSKSARFNPSNVQESSFRQTLEKRSIFTSQEQYNQTAASDDVGTTSPEEIHKPHSSKTHEYEQADAAATERTIISTHLPPPEKGILKQKSKFDMSSPSFLLNATTTSKHVFINEDEVLDRYVGSNGASSSVPLMRTLESTNLELPSESDPEMVTSKETEEVQE